MTTFGVLIGWVFLAVAILVSRIAKDTRTKVILLLGVFGSLSLFIPIVMLATSVVWCWITNAPCSDG